LPTDNYKKILIAPLDWGLGHTTRCIPVIRHLVNSGHYVSVACNDTQSAFLKKSFPDMEFITLDGYNMRYSKSGKTFFFTFLWQLPKLLRRIRQEHKWLSGQIAKSRFDGIISDNRYGLFHPHVPAAIITHQLQVQTGLGATINNRLLRLHYKYLNRFGETWVPDVAGHPNLSGELGHPRVLPSRVHYLGLLSRLAIQDCRQGDGDSLMILLSGPEPQRSILSGILWQQVQEYKGKVVFVEGSNNAAQPAIIPQHIHYYKQIGDKTLLPLLRDSAMIICRSGYSTLMDIVALNKKAIIIPTPAQTEQEYLGTYLHQQEIFYCTAQKNFDLEHALAASAKFPFKTLPLQQSYSGYQQALDRWIASL
jgi:hypothetical protein